MRRIIMIVRAIDIDFCNVFCSILFALSGLLLLCNSNRIVGGLYLCCSIVFAFVFVFDIAINYRKLKCAELPGIVEKLHFHPDRSPEEAVAEAVSGARYWTFKTVWKKLRNSHDYGRVFTGIFR